MKKYLIVCGGEIVDYTFLKKTVDEYNPDFIIAADSGLDALNKIGIKPDLLLGDMDSVRSDIGEYKDNTIKLNVEKDDTDTGIAVNFAIKNQADDILIMPGVGSRFDHSFANMLLCRKCLKNGINCRLKNEHNEIFVRNKSFEIQGKIGATVSFYALEPTVITLKGFYYPLDNFFYEEDGRIGTSNIITDEKAEVIFDKGEILAVISND